MKNLNGKRSKWLIRLGVVAAVIALMQFLPSASTEPDAQTMAELSCIAESVALQQALFARHEAGIDPVPFLAEFEGRFRALQRLQRSLNMPHAGRYSQAFRRVMVQAEARRAAGVASTPDLYVASAWTEVQRCHDTILDKESN